MMLHFILEEFACPCCGKNNVDGVFLEKLDKVRSDIRIPLRVNSGYRCEKHNRIVGGKEDSYHLKGLAADISTAIMPSATKFELLNLALHAFQGIGISKSFFHFDLRPGEKALWVY